jgi:hypothetical protein
MRVMTGSTSGPGRSFRTWSGQAGPGYGEHCKLDHFQVFKDRMAIAFEELNQAERALDFSVTNPEALKPLSRSFQRDRSHLKKEIARHRKGLSSLDGSVSGLDQSDNASKLAACWAELSRLRGLCLPLFGECLAFAAGPLLRGVYPRGGSLDNGLCRIADEMLEEISVPTELVWSRQTILSETEFLGDIAQIVRIRFPVTSIWDLPVAVHEFGHYVGLKNDLDSLAEDDREQNWVQEHFADMFATYMFGPAFACTCLLLRFDPAADPNWEWGSHPSYAMRAHAILRTLAMMEEEKSPADREMTGISTFLSGIWQDCLNIARRGGRLNSTNARLLEKWIPQLYQLIDVACSDGKYERWRRAEALGRDLVSGARRRDTEARRDIFVRDVINGGWHAYKTSCTGIQQAHEVSEKAISWCHALIDARGGISGSD